MKLHIFLEQHLVKTNDIVRSSLCNRNLKITAKYQIILRFNTHF